MNGKPRRMLAFTKSYGWIAVKEKPGWDGWYTAPGDYSVPERSILAMQNIPDDPTNRTDAAPTAPARSQ